MEETLIIIKPDAMKKRFMGEILSRFEKNEFTIKKLTMTHLTKDFVKKFYAHLDGRFHPNIIADIHDFMTSYPVVFAILEGNDAVKRARALCGPTDPAKAPKGTIRGDFSNDSMEERNKKLEATQNAIHSSGSVEEAKVEISMILELMREQEALLHTKR